MNAFLQQLADPLAQLLSALGVAVLAFLRAYVQRKLADAAVAHAEARGGTGPQKKVIATVKLARAPLLLRPRSSKIEIAVEQAHSRMKA